MYNVDNACAFDNRWKIWCPTGEPIGQHLLTSGINYIILNLFVVCDYFRLKVLQRVAIEVQVLSQWSFLGCSFPICCDQPYRLCLNNLPGISLY